jgi:hypothetical protein
MMADLWGPIKKLVQFVCHIKQNKVFVFSFRLPFSGAHAASQTIHGLCFQSFYKLCLSKSNMTVFGGEWPRSRSADGGSARRAEAKIFKFTLDH